jgi:hypothetical protein
VVLAGEGMVALYRGAGDTVVSNPEGTAGVKVVGGDGVCLDRWACLFAAVPEKP